MNPPAHPPLVAALLELSRGLTDQQFFERLVVKAAEVLGAHCTFVGELSDDALHMESVALCDGGAIVAGSAYPLAGTPCERVIRSGTCVFPGGVQAEFPEDDLLREMGIEGYLGVQLSGSGGRPNGILVALFRTCIADPAEATRIVDAFADRAAVVLDRLRGERRLRAGEARLNSILRAVPDLILALDRDGNYVEVFTGAAHLLAAPAEDVVGRNVRELLDAALAERTVRVSRRVIDTGEAGTFAYELATGGVLRQWTAKIVPWQAGSETLALWATRDVTELRRAERELQRARRMESLGQLAAGIAHDFNNVLHVITAAAELLRDPAGAAASETVLDDLLDAAARGARLTQQLLAVGQRRALRVQLVDAHGIIERTLALLRRLLPANLEVRWRPEAATANVLCDPGGLEQVLMNLCLNARDALPDGGEIEVRSRTVGGPDGGGPDGGGPQFELSVGDSGPGMSAEVAERAFEPFFTTKGTPGHGGMGLAIVHGVVTQHGGTVSLGPAPLGGLCVTVRLPLQGGAPASEPATRSHVRPAAAGTVLLAEDHELVRRLVARVLRTAGYEVTTAAHGEEALRLFEQDPAAIDLALLDVVMPRMGGRELARRLRARRPDLPLLLTSGYDACDVPGAAHAADAGVELLAKPYGNDELLGAVARLLAGARAPGNGTALH